MNSDPVFSKVNIVDWAKETIVIIEQAPAWDRKWNPTWNKLWNSAWEAGYYKVGGQSDSVVIKPCPRGAAKTLYALGRFIGFRNECIDMEYQEVMDTLSKNGVYALLSVEKVSEDGDIAYEKLWRSVCKNYNQLALVEPRARHREQISTIAGSDQGGVKMTYKLWQSGVLRNC